MSKEQMIKRVSQQLLDLSDVFISSTGCHGVWGEVEVPECLRKELEEKQEQQELEDAIPENMPTQI